MNSAFQFPCPYSQSRSGYDHDTAACGSVPMCSSAHMDLLISGVCARSMQHLSTFPESA